jgi:hypothetical protein
MISHEAFEPVNVKHWALIVWPAFVTACLLEALVFSVVDPSELRLLGLMLHPSHEAFYSISFFCFWLISMLGSGLTWWLACPNRTTQYADLV